MFSLHIYKWSTLLRQPINKHTLWFSIIISLISLISIVTFFSCVCKSRIVWFSSSSLVRVAGTLFLIYKTYMYARMFISMPYHTYSISGISCLLILTAGRIQEEFYNPPPTISLSPHYAHMYFICSAINMHGYYYFFFFT